jgi:hypothetical protein
LSSFKTSAARPPRLTTLEPFFFERAFDLRRQQRYISHSEAVSPFFSKFKTAVRTNVSPPSFKRFVQFLKQLLDHSVASKVYIDPSAFYQVAQLDLVSSPTLSVDTVLFDT